ncbi:hypothetical protein OROGR_002387 [Orobanche gracilis]
MKSETGEWKKEEKEVPNEWMTEDLYHWLVFAISPADEDDVERVTDDITRAVFNFTAAAYFAANFPNYVVTMDDARRFIIEEVAADGADEEVEDESDEVTDGD